MRRTPFASHLLLLGSATLSGALAQTARNEIEWSSQCDDAFEENAVLPIECGTLKVPLDYLEPTSNSTIDLEILRVPALKQPAKGSVVVHFGGPGPSGRAAMVGMAEWMQVVTGQEFDLISWDQRGTGNAIPVRCYETPSEMVASPIALVNPGVNSTDSMQTGRNWALVGQYARDCYENVKDTHGDMVGTAYTARDIMSMIDALGDENLRYYGFSYGTVLGATTAAMFPDRIESMVLDGVHNPHLYWAGFDTEMLTDMDKTFSTFLELCFERADECALALNNPDDSPAIIEERIVNMIETRKLRPIGTRHEEFGSVLIDQNLIKTFLRPALYNPINYPVLAEMLHLLLVEDIGRFLTVHAEFLASINPVFTEGLDNDGAALIPWVDKLPHLYTDDLDDVVPVLDEYVNASKLTGDLLSMNVHGGAQFSLNSKEQYTAGFHDVISTRKPLLVVGNEYDVATPWISAKNISASFEGSGLFKHNAHGHGTNKMASLCTMKTFISYFTEGVVPEPGTVCDPEHHPWDPPNFEELYPELGYVRPNSTN